jgi:hypothetical protein
MIKIEFKTENAGFWGDGSHKEVAVMIRDIANSIERGETARFIRDRNDNKIGHWSADFETKGGEA